MKTYITGLLIVLGSITSHAQTLGGHSITDHLVNAVHPNGCNGDYVTGPPNDSIWVNVDTFAMTGDFGMPWTDVNGRELLLETGYHRANYNVRMLLPGGLYSAIHNVLAPDWTQITNQDWKYIDNGCTETSSADREHFILPLDFNLDFGLTSSDTVIGIEITFLLSTGFADFAGAYIVDPPCSQLSSSFDITNASSGLINGSVTVHVTNGTAPYLYSINGIDYQFDSSFADLSAGAHTIYFIDDNGCVGQDDFTIGMDVSVSSQYFESIEIYPNPFYSELTINFNSHPSDYIDLFLIDMLGRVVFSDQIEIGSIKTMKLNPSLPVGPYILELTDGNETQLYNVLRSH